jgi:hypothetical protein
MTVWSLALWQGIVNEYAVTVSVLLCLVCLLPAILCLWACTPGSGMLHLDAYRSQ